jgi:hypothetical protein
MIHNFITGISDEAASVAPPYPINSFNWVVGHILSGRQRAIRALGREDFLPETMFTRYVTGSDPVTAESDDAVPLSAMQAYLQTSQEALAAALEAISTDELAEVIETRFGPRPVGEHVSGLHWHETYHVGQLEILREIALPAAG